MPKGIPNSKPAADQFPAGDVTVSGRTVAEQNWQDLISKCEIMVKASEKLVFVFPVPGLTAEQYQRIAEDRFAIFEQETGVRLLNKVLDPLAGGYKMNRLGMPVSIPLWKAEWL